MNSIFQEMDIVEKAGRLLDLGRHQSALDTIQELKESPSAIVFSSYCTIVIECLTSLDKLQEALDFAHSKLSEKPDEPNLHYYLSKINSARNKPQKALSNIIRAIEINPEVSYYHTSASAIYFDLGNTYKANHHLRIAEEKEPDSLQNIYLRSLYLINKRKQKEAEVHIKNGLSLYPESSLLQSLYRFLNSDYRPSIGTLKELSLTALASNPFDKEAQENLLYSLKHSNAAVRFFVAKGFSRYKMKWTVGRVILAIVIWKGTLLWGSFALLYLLVTWAGTALFFSVIRKHPKYKMIIPQYGLKMSNAFLVITGLATIVTSIVVYRGGDTVTIFGTIAGFLFLLLTVISYFVIKTKEGKVSYALFMAFSFLVLLSSFGDLLVLGFVSILLTLLYAFLFTLNITFR